MIRDSDIERFLSTPTPTVGENTVRWFSKYRKRFVLPGLFRDGLSEHWIIGGVVQIVVAYFWMFVMFLLLVSLTRPDNPFLYLLGFIFALWVCFRVRGSYTGQAHFFLVRFPCLLFRIVCYVGVATSLVYIFFFFHDIMK